MRSLWTTMMMKVLLAILLWLTAPNLVQASAKIDPADQSLIHISPDFKMATIGRRMSMLREEEVTYTLDQINSLPASAYRQWKNVNIIFGHIRKAFWLKFQLINSDTIDRQLIFEIVDPHLYEIH
ncbi:MAG: 7TM-DISM domain-containing protein, partial [Bacteroidota bacterium]